MFVLYAIPVGLVVGLLLGGQIERLSWLSFRWLPLAIVGLGVQLAIFSTPLGNAAGGLAPAIYVLSTAAVLVVVVRNLAIPGLAIVALGAASNFLAIVANGGYMPSSAEAEAALGRATAAGYSNSVVLADPVFGPLTDVFALPAWMPLANVFSVGDVAIGLGVAVTIVMAMRRTGRDPGAAGGDA